MSFADAAKARLLETLSAREIASLACALAGAHPGAALTRVVVAGTRSRILERNGGIVFASRYVGLSGLFRKRAVQPEPSVIDDPWTARFGRIACNAVQVELRRRGFPRNGGFFTSDELPAYGISMRATRQLCPDELEVGTVLRAFFAYPEDEAAATKRALDELLCQLREALADRCREPRQR